MNQLYLECYSGISGDMFVASLLDLGASKEVLEEVLSSLSLTGFKTEITRVNKSGLDVCDFNVILNHDNHDHDMNYLYGEHTHHEHHHHHDHDDEDGHEHCCHHHHEDEEHEHHHHHHGDGECDDPECACHHHHHHADEVFTSWGAETPKQFTQADIDRILTALDSGEYGAILRAKGIVPAADGQWLHFDYVPQEHEVRYGAADYTGRLCVIGSQLKEDGLKTLFGL